MFLTPLDKSAQPLLHIVDVSEPSHTLPSTNVSQPISYELPANPSNRIGHAFRKSAAGAFGPDLAKKLSQLVKMEKNVMRSMELVGRERMEVAVSLAANPCSETLTVSPVQLLTCAT